MQQHINNFPIYIKTACFAKTELMSTILQITTFCFRTTNQSINDFPELSPSMGGVSLTAMMSIFRLINAKFLYLDST